ncbi:hypothetical protein [Butyrivibrio sp. MC2013]|uniref:hypothetical protein n=1 Tax=Butyrivibrio sp. MC2013 TaxID=1280686 RepID=UPI000422B0A7|nr:hypothetical protein [Butyrivibrio sp. MC2013]
MAIDVQMGYNARRAAAVYGKPSVKSATETVVSSSKLAKANVGAIRIHDANRAESFARLVSTSICNQFNAYTKANNNTLWGTVSGGKFTIDKSAKNQAKRDVASGGYWSCEETSDRLFDYALTMAEHNPAMLIDFSNAASTGFEQAKSSIKDDLPGLCSDTLEALKQKFEERISSFDSVRVMS